jgi:hypothetical protein
MRGKSKSRQGRKNALCLRASIGLVISFVPGRGLCPLRMARIPALKRWAIVIKIDRIGSRFATRCAWFIIRVSPNERPARQ